jgi:hypothetical protein
MSTVCEKVEDFGAMFRKMTPQTGDANERRYRQQMNESAAAFESGNQNRIVAEIAAQANQQIEAVQAEIEKQFQQQHQRFEGQLKVIAKNYERIIKQREFEIGSSNSIHKSELEARLETSQFELDSAHCHAMLE